MGGTYSFSSGGVINCNSITVGGTTYTKFGALATQDEVVIKGTFNFGSDTLSVSGPSISGATAVYTLSLPKNITDAKAGTYTVIDEDDDVYKSGSSFTVSSKTYYESNDPTATGKTVYECSIHSAGTYYRRGSKVTKSSITVSTPSTITATLEVKAQKAGG